MGVLYEALSSGNNRGCRIDRVVGSTCMGRSMLYDLYPSWKCAVLHHHLLLGWNRGAGVLVEAPALGIYRPPEIYPPSKEGKDCCSYLISIKSSGPSNDSPFKIKPFGVVFSHSGITLIFRFNPKARDLSGTRIVCLSPSDRGRPRAAMWYMVWSTAPSHALAPRMVRRTVP